jgi:hypothetical protein
MTKLIRDLPAALPLQTRLAPIAGVDVAARTAEVVFSTGAAVRRQRWSGWDTVIPFDEILVVSNDAVDMTRLNAGAPALDSHSYWSTSSQIGVIDKAWIAGADARALIRFPSKGVDLAADRMFAMVSEGIIRNVSCGYFIQQVRVEQPQKAGEVEQRIVEKWQPYEISFVTVPADKGAQVRADDQQQQVPVAFRGVLRALPTLNVAATARMRMRQASA